MIPIFKNYISKSDNSLTWSTEWLSEFESPWSIFEKIKYTNELSKKDLFYLFTYSHNNNTNRGKTNNNLYKMHLFDEKNFEKLLGFSLKKYNEDLILNLSTFLNNSDRKKRKPSVVDRYWRDSLTFCSQCIKDGYHSILHQFELLTVCAFHGIPLTDQCPNCKIKYPYEISDINFFEAPFICTCGYVLKDFQRASSLYSIWKNYSQTDLIDSNVKSWLEMDNNHKKKLNAIYLYPHTSMHETPQLLQFFIDRSGTASTASKKKYVIVKSSFHIQRWNNINYVQNMYNYNLRTSDDEIKYLNDSFYYAQTYEKIVKSECIKARIHVYSAIAKHLRKTILKKHKSCIKRFTSVVKKIDGSDIPICPFAYAYVRCRQQMMRIDYYYDVDSKPYGYNRQNEVSDLTLTGLTDHDPILDLIHSYLNFHPIKQHNYSNLRWLISHMYGFLYLHLFKYYLLESKHYYLFNEDITLKNILAFDFSKSDINEVKVFLDQENINQFLASNTLVCPYPTRKLKRKSPNEKSFHPLEIAIEQVNRADR